MNVPEKTLKDQKMFKNILLTTAIVSLAAPAIAGGMSEPVITAPAAVAPVRTAASDWTGFYVGGQLGTLRADTEFLATEFDPTAPAGDTVDVEVDGSFAGIHAGYMYDLGSLVVGGEFDFDAIDFDDITATYNGTSVTESAEGSDDTVARLKLRAGYDAGRFLPYATAGVARIDSGDENTNGSFYGAGVAFAATDSILVGGEILQHKFDDAFDSGTDIDIISISLRASYKF